MDKINGVYLNSLKKIDAPGGEVFHILKKGDLGYVDFGEVYISSIRSGAIKQWKRHSRMTLNLVVIKGLVRFVVHDDRPFSSTIGSTEEYAIGLPDNYSRLTIAPGLWVAFQGLGPDTNLVLNVADIAHDPEEMDRGDQDLFPFDWSI